MILGIDYGSKRIGLARSDEAGIFAHGFGFIGRRIDASEVNKIIKIIKDYGVKTVVIGHPLNMNGSVGVKAREAQDFAKTLHELTEAEIKLWDERLTTREAERYLIEQDMSRSRRKKKVDQLAAQIMLQGYMDAQRK